MELLRIATIVYAAVLVAALAASLIAILVWLIRIGRALGEARDALASVAEKTKPLEQFITPLRDQPRDALEQLKAARATFARADERMNVLAERLGAVPVER